MRDGDRTKNYLLASVAGAMLFTGVVLAGLWTTDALGLRALLERETAWALVAFAMGGVSTVVPAAMAIAIGLLGSEAGPQHGARGTRQAQVAATPSDRSAAAGA